MKRYIYILEGSIPAPAVIFNGPESTFSARQQAEGEYGPNGELFVIVPKLPEPGTIFSPPEEQPNVLCGKK